MSTITVDTTVQVPIQKAWELWTGPEHIEKWCNADDTWHVPSAENDLREGGRFKTVMAAKDGSASFDFAGTYTNVTGNERIEYTLDDERKVSVVFQEVDENTTKVTETFETESINSEEMQKAGWQSILDNFKRYTEEHKAN